MMRSVWHGVTAFAIVTIVTPITCIAVVLGALIFLPLPATLPLPKAILDSQASHVFDADGNEIAVFKPFETSIPVEQGDIPQVLKDAVVAAEDHGFYDHGGIDFRGTLRALWADLNNQKVVEGGSTITQQYVKQAFTGGERTLSRKLREAILANQLDRQLDKDTILFRYLSASYFGEGAYGVGAAAQTFFRKPVSELTVSEAALLASVLPAPTSYSPRDHPAVAEENRVRVLDQMLELGSIDNSTHDLAVAEKLQEATAEPPVSPATVVYAPEVAGSTEPWFRDYVHDWLQRHLPGCSVGDCPIIESGGLKVITTLDHQRQLDAERDVADAMGDNEPNLQMALVAVEPPTGYIKAMVGGRDFNYSQNNVAILPRQPGSAFKPYVLAAAFEQGIQPTALYSGAPFTTGGTTIQNYANEAFGTIPLRLATWDSVNAVFARLILDVGVDKAMEMASRLGAPVGEYNPATDGASVALGAKEVSPLNMASAFGVFANNGRRAEPIPVLQVFDGEGKLLIDNTKSAEAATQVIDPIVAGNVTDVLRGVLTDGTAAGKGIDRPAAGKTGTATDAANAWFIGFTPTLSTSVWMGHLDCGASDPGVRDCGLRNINGVREVVGGTIPASVWQKFMTEALADVPVTEFAEPAPIQTFADEAKRRARGGFDPGPQRSPAEVPKPPAVETVEPPTADVPTATSSTTTTTSTTSTSTTTTIPPLLN